MLRHLILNERAGLGWGWAAAAVCGAGAKGCEPSTVGNARGLASGAGPWVGTELTGVAFLCHGAMCPGIVVGGMDLGTEIGRTLRRRPCLSAGDSVDGVGIAGIRAQ